MGIYWDIPDIRDIAGLVMTVTVRELEHGPVEIVDLPTENGGSFHSYVNLPESNSNFTMVFVDDIYYIILYDDIISNY